MSYDLSYPVSTLPLIGPSHIPKLAKLGIRTLHDLLHYYPFRHIDSSINATIASVQFGETVTLQGMILSISNSYIRGGKTLQKAMFSDGTGVMPITWFNQTYLVQTFQKQPHVSVSGTIKPFKGKPSLLAPNTSYLKIDQSPSLKHKTLFILEDSCPSIQKHWEFLQSGSDHGLMCSGEKSEIR